MDRQALDVPRTPGMAVEVFIAEEVQSQKARLVLFRPPVDPMPDFTPSSPFLPPRTPSPLEAEKVLGGGRMRRE